MPFPSHSQPLSSALFFLLLFLPHPISTDDDASIMALFARSLIPPPPTWVGPDYCKWQGVSCHINHQVNSIDLNSQSIRGSVPPDINRLSALRSLSLQKNHLSGPVPNISNLPSLEELYLDDNDFTSIPPGFLSGLASLQAFHMDNNTRLPPWTIPTSLKNSTSLRTFSAVESNLYGEIPDIFGSLPSLQTLRLSYNNLTGWLPWSLAKSPIQDIWLNNQAWGFVGRLDVLNTMKDLTIVALQGNRFTGPIPDLSGCTELMDLQLRDNFLTGMIPNSVTTLPKLLNISLQNNKFQGPVPVFRPGIQVNLGTTNQFCLPTPGPCNLLVTALLEAVSSLDYPLTLAEAWEGNNPCQQWQFITCDRGSVTIINFARQGWTGSISPAFSKLPNLKMLLLNNNRLTGRIPANLTSLKHLEILDVSNNNLSGKIPNFPSYVVINTLGNPNIGTELSDDPKTTIIVFIIVFLLFFLGVAAAGFNAYKRRRNKRTKDNEKTIIKGESGRQTIIDIDKVKYNMKSGSILGSTWNASPSARSITSDYNGYDIWNSTIPFEVLRDATDNFCESNILGRGGFGVVYRGNLQDGTRVAVKRMESSVMSNKGLHEFKAEIEVLTKVRHRNLVALLGFCDNGSEKLLVYEYMPQGCLGEHLFHWKDKGIPLLTWNQRVTIALDVARGIEYLHSMTQQSFIHRDLKPSNILLEDNLRAKVSDFGLVRSAPDGSYSVETRLAGTFGYLAPEYAATGRVTTKVDVYAFGVVLMEMITGRKALDASLPDEQIHLVTWFRSLIHDKGEVRDNLDHTLLADIDQEKFSNIWTVVELAGHCTAREAYNRPDMSHVVNVLSSLVDNWKPSPEHDEIFDIDIHMSLPQALQRWKAYEDQSTMMTTDFFTREMTPDHATTSESTTMNIDPHNSSSSQDSE